MKNSQSPRTTHHIPDLIICMVLVVGHVVPDAKHAIPMTLNLPVCKRLCFFRKYLVVNDLPHVSHFHDLVSVAELWSIASAAPAVTANDSLLALVVSRCGGGASRSHSSVILVAICVTSPSPPFWLVAALAATPNTPCTMRKCNRSDPFILKYFAQYSQWNRLISVGGASSPRVVAGAAPVSLVVISCTSRKCMRCSSFDRNVYPQM